MKLSQVYAGHTPKQPVDFNDLSSLTQQLVAVSDELSAMSEDVAKAKTIREYNGDQLKRALAIATREFLGHESAAASEIKGRASIRYGEDLEALKEDLHEAERTLARHEALRIRWESLRSATSSLKAIAANI